MVEEIPADLHERVKMLAPTLMHEQIEDWLKFKYGYNSAPQNRK
jgi:hypothetical protein